MSTIVTGLFTSSLLVALALALGSYIGLVIRELAADKVPVEASGDDVRSRP